MTDLQKKKALRKLFEVSQELSIEAFMSESKTSAILYDASNLVDMAVRKLKELDITEEKVYNETASVTKPELLLS